MLTKSLGLLGLVMLVASAGAAQEAKKLTSILPHLNSQAAVAADCGSATKYDDGVFENGYTFNAADARFVQRFDVTGPANLTSVCVCLQRASSDATLNFNIHVYDDNGAGGTPGTLITSVPATATGIPFGIGGAFYGYDLGSIATDGSVYVGIQYNGLTDDDIYLCADEGPGVARPAYGSINGGAFWASLPAVFGASFEALGVRAGFETNTSACTPGASTLCLNKGRFEVEASYRTSGGQQGAAQVVKLTDETGYLWFFNAVNVEAVVKVLDACGLNGKFWVFAGGLTNVEVQVTVTDTETGNQKTYTNPQGKAFQPIQDTAALSCN